MKFWSLAAITTLAVVRGEETAPPPAEVSCPPCDSALWKSKAEATGQLHSTCVASVADWTSKHSSCDTDRTQTATKLSAQVAEVEKLTKMLATKDAELKTALSSSQVVESLNTQLAAAQKESQTVKDAAAKKTAEIEKVLVDVKKQRDEAVLAKDNSQKRENEANSELSLNSRNLVSIRRELASLQEELNQKNKAVFNKEQFYVLSNNLWTVSKALMKNALARVRTIVGQDKFESGMDMANLYYGQSMTVVYSNVVDPVNMYYQSYGAAVAGPIISKVRMLAADTKDKMMVHVDTAKSMLEVRVDESLKKLAVIEPKIAEIFPAEFEDRIYAIAFVMFGLYVACNVLGTFGNTILGTISFVCCCRRRQTHKEKKKSSHKSKSASSTEKKDRKTSVPATNGTKPEQPKGSTTNVGNKAGKR